MLYTEQGRRPGQKPWTERSVPWVTTGDLKRRGPTKTSWGARCFTQRPPRASQHPYWELLQRHPIPSQTSWKKVSGLDG